MSSFVRREKRVVVPAASPATTNGTHQSDNNTNTQPDSNSTENTRDTEVQTRILTVTANTVQRPTRAVPGTRTWLNSLTLTSTGCSALDTLIGGGVILNTCILVKQDKHTNTHSNLLKYFISDGIAYAHNLINVSAHTQAEFEQYLYTLPYNNTTHNTDTDNVVQSITDLTTDDTLQLNNASRYSAYLQPNRAVDSTSNLISSKSQQQRSSSRATTLCCSYDFNKHIDESAVRSALPHRTHISVYDGNTQTASELYNNLFEQVKQALLKFECMYSQSSDSNNITRIAIHSNGDIPYCYNSSDNATTLIHFVYRLQALMRQCRAICMLTLPTTLYTADTVRRIQHICDMSLSLAEFKQSFDMYTQQTATFGDFDGVLNIEKVSQLHTITPSLPHETEYLYKMTRRKLVLERVSLPPEQSRTESEHTHDTKKSVVKQRQSAGGTGTKNNKAIDF